MGSRDWFHESCDMMTSLTALTNPLATAAFSTPSTAAWATSLAPETAVSATMLACSVVFWATGGQEVGSRKQEVGSEKISLV